jgi:hypothetical protein
MRGRTLVVTVLAALAPAATAHAAGDPIMPLDQVQPGMKCTGYSVFKGTTVEPFDVEIQDVVGGNVSGETAPRLLVRVSGPKVDATGVGPGFSGSPIYCPGADGVQRNAGAISETIGDYGGKTVLATPIEQIVGTPVDAPAAPAPPPQASAARTEQSFGGPRAADAALLARARPLASPLTVRGLDRPIYDALAKAAARNGITVVQGPPAPISASTSAPAPLVPGSAFGVGLSSGDISVGAIGTITYVDGDKVWGFGHPFDGAGARALFLQDAYVAGIINNPIQLSDLGGTYKFAGPVHDIGTLSDDAFNAVAGRTGPLPPRIPVRVYSKDLDTNTEHDLLVNVADETDVGNPTGISGISFVGPLAVVQGATDALGSTPLRVAGQMCFQVVVREIKAPLRFCNRYVSDGTAGSPDGTVGNLLALTAANDAAGALALLDTYKGSNLHVTEVSARFSETRGQRQAYLRSLTLPRRVRAGADVPARLRIKVVRGGTRTIDFRFHVPRSLHRGAHSFVLSGTDPDGSQDLFGTITIDLGDLSAPSDTEGPRKASQLARSFRSLHRWDGIRLRGTGSRVYRDPTYRIGGSAHAMAVVTRG